MRLTHDLWKLPENVLEKERLKVTHAVSTLFSFLCGSSLIYWGFFFPSEFPCLFFPCNLIVPWHLLNIWPHGPLLFSLIHCCHLVLKSWLFVLSFPLFFLLLFLIYPYCCYYHHSTSFPLLVTLVDWWAPCVTRTQKHLQDLKLSGVCPAALIQSREQTDQTGGCQNNSLQSEQGMHWVSS